MDGSSTVWFFMGLDLKISLPVSSTPNFLQIFTTMIFVLRRLPVCFCSGGNSQVLNLKFLRPYAPSRLKILLVPKSDFVDQHLILLRQIIVL